ncbi:MAG: pyridoxamine 5'-phosphate oxidase family protein [Acidimicrobiales bacterium]
MGKVHDSIDDALRSWIERQHMFFVATAALAADATVNVSPKGTDGTLAVLDDHRVAYLDLTGSGIETVAHLRENGRITLMWCAFDGPPRIVRIQGRGHVVGPDDDEWAVMLGHLRPHRGARAIVVVTAIRIFDSCGYSVPRMEFVEQRPTLDDWTERKSDDELDDYRRARNATSLDGLPGLPTKSDS